MKSKLFGKIALILAIIFMIPAAMFVQNTPAKKGPKIIYGTQPQKYTAGMYGELPISFSLPVVELSDFDQMTNKLSKMIKITSQPPVKGFIRASGTQNAAFVFLEPLKPSTLYTFTINADQIKSVDGKNVITSINYVKVKDNKYLYTTPIIQVNSCYAGDKTLSTYVYVSFNTPVKLGSFIKALKIEDVDDNPIKYKIKHYIYTNKTTVNNEEIWYINTNTSYFYVYPQGLKPDTLYYVNIETNLMADGGSIPLKKTFYYKFNTYAALQLTEFRSSSYYDNNFYPGSAIVAIFNNTLVENQKFLQYVTVEPKLKNLKVEASGSYLYINGDFVGGKSYTVKIKKGFKDVFGQTIAEDIVKTAEFEHAFSYFNFPSGYMVMENYLPFLLPFKVRNVSSLDFSYNFFTSLEDIARNLYDEDNKMQKSDTIELKWEWDRLYFYKLDLSKKVTKKSGVMFYSAHPQRESAGGYYDDYYHYNGIILFTDLGVTVKYGAGDTLVYVRSLKNNQPVKGAAVYELFQGSAKQLGVTGMDGILSCKTVNQNPLIGVDYQGTIGLSYGGSTKWWGDTYYVHETRFMLFSDRFLYKPGDSIEIKGIIRFREADNWVLDKGKLKSPITFNVYNSKNEQITNFEMKLSDWGSLNFTLKTDLNATTGYYYIYALQNGKNIAYYNFRVEDYKPAKAEMKIIPLQTSYVWGEKFKCDMIGWYLFGAPIVKPISYNIQIAPASYWSTRYPQYSFSEYRSYYYYDEYYYNSYDYSFTLASETIMADQDGRITVEQLLENKNFKGDGMITVSASTVLDDKSTVYSSKSGMWLYNPVHVGINIQSYFAEQGKPFEINLIALDHQENIYEGQKATLEITKYGWKSVQKVETGGKVYWEWVQDNKVVHKEDVVIGQKTVKVKINEPGYFIANIKSVVRGHEMVSSWSFYVIGSGYVGWKIDNDNYLQLESDKKEYAVGDTAKILVKNPYKNAKAMITIEREKVHSVQFMDAKDSMLVIPVKITEEHVPNFYVSVMLYTARTGTGVSNIVDGIDTAKPAFKMGTLNVPVALKEKTLSVTVKADKEKYEPGEKATVTVTVKDSKNKTVPAEVTVVVADKGVLNLVNYQIPNPLYYFYSQRPNAIYTMDISDLIIGQRYLAEKGEVIGGDGEDNKKAEMAADSPSAGEGAKNGQAPGMIVPRINFKATAFYTANLIIEQGVGTVSFNVPDNLSTFKVMAVAQTKDSKFGYGDSAITISKPLMILLTLPEFVRMLDEVEAGGMVYNYTGADASVTVTIKADNIAQFISKSTTNVTIPKNGSAEVKFKFKVIPSTREKIDFVITAQTGKFTDGIQKSLPIKMPKFLETTALYEKTPNTAKEKLLITDNVIPEMSRMEFNLSPSAFSELSGNVDYLVKYPYGCLEQKSSQMLPLILGSDIIIKHKLLKEKTAEELKQIVQTFIDEVPKYAKSYGFGYYADSYYHCPYLTVYVTFVLSMAKQSGYIVPNGLMKKAAQWIIDYAADRGTYSTYGWSYSPYYKKLTQAFALYVAALNGSYDIVSLKRIYNDLQGTLQNNLPAKANLLKAAAYYKKAQKYVNDVNPIIEDLQTDFLALARVEASTVYFESYNQWDWFYYTDVITTSQVLQALIESDADFKDSHKVINWLIKMRKADHWISTHENAMVFWSMSTYLRKFEKEDPNFKATVMVNQDKIVETMFKSPTDPIFTQAYKFKAGTKGEMNLTLSKEGPGMLYYNIKYQYMLKEYPKKKDAGFSVSKTFFDYDTGLEVKDNVFIRGKRYIVKINIYTPKDRVFVVIDDQLPAGFEAVNLDFATEANEKKVQEGSQWWWGSFYHTEKYFDRVVFSADYLYSGNHTVTYVVRANTPGNYQVPQIWVEEMYFPEVFGYSYQPNVTIIEDTKKGVVDKQK